jgi:hypothetical protein
MIFIIIFVLYNNTYEKILFYNLSGKSQGSISTWNQVIDKSPMRFIKDIQAVEENGGNRYRDFVVINTCDISEDDFIYFKDKF